MTDYLWVEDTVREIVTDLVLQVEQEHAKHLTEELRIQARQLDAYAARIEELKAALKPFAEKADDVLKKMHGGHVNYIPELISVTLGDLRAASDALEKKHG